jgi:hypothetical protein
MKKIILLLFGLLLTSVAFSQVEGYFTAFEQASLIQTKDWTVSDNRCFKVDSEIYVLAYEPINEKVLSGTVMDRDLYLYRKVADGWVKASPVIRHDYFYFDKSIQVLDIEANKYNIRDGKSMCYGTINIDPDNGNVTIGLKTWIWKKGEPQMHPIYQDLILTRNYDKTYNFMSLKAK